MKASMVFVIELSQVPETNTVTELKHELQKMNGLAKNRYLFFFHYGVSHEKITRCFGSIVCDQRFR